MSVCIYFARYLTDPGNKIVRYHGEVGFRAESGNSSRCATAFCNHKLVESLAVNMNLASDGFQGPGEQTQSRIRMYVVRRRISR